jgi:hypothetical protein
VIGSAGANGGNYNAAISGCTPATSIVNYSNQAQIDSAGNTIHVAVPGLQDGERMRQHRQHLLQQAPDVIVKAAFDPGLGPL